MTFTRTSTRDFWESSHYEDMMDSVRFTCTVRIFALLVALLALTMSAAAVVFDLLAPVLFFVALAVVWREWALESSTPLSTPQFVVRALRAPPAV